MTTCKSDQPSVRIRMHPFSWFRHKQRIYTYIRAYIQMNTGIENWSICRPAPNAFVYTLHIIARVCWHATCMRCLCVENTERRRHQDCMQEVRYRFRMWPTRKWYASHAHSYTITQFIAQRRAAGKRERTENITEPPEIRAKCINHSEWIHFAIDCAQNVCMHVLMYTHTSPGKRRQRSLLLL